MSSQRIFLQRARASGRLRRFIERVEQVIVLADATKFERSSGNVAYPLSEIDILITDARIAERAADYVRDAGVELIIADQ